MATGDDATIDSPFDGGFGFSGYASQGTGVELVDEFDRDESLDESGGPILPPPSEMVSEEGFALREWRRLNAIRLAEKEKEEKEMLREIIEGADEFKREFYRKRQITVENRKASNREKEKQYLANQASFHAEAHKSYWKAIAELIPREVPTIQKKGKKDKDKKQPSFTVVTGPKPGKPTDMSRMRNVLVKLKHNPPPHMNPKPPAEEIEKGGKTNSTPTSANASGKTGANSSASPSPQVPAG